MNEVVNIAIKRGLRFSLGTVRLGADGRVDYFASVSERARTMAARDEERDDTDMMPFSANLSLQTSCARRISLCEL